MSHFDHDAVKEKYLAERDKRLVPGRDRHSGPQARRNTSRVSAKIRSRRAPSATPVTDDVDVTIIGGGIAGVLAGVQLRKAGVERIRIVDQAGGVGAPGTGTATRA